MKAVLPLLLAVALSAPAAHAASLNGHTYLSLADWADDNGFRIAAHHSDALTLTNRSARLVFGKDSRTAQINGVNVALSYPVAADKGQFSIAALDLSKSVEPLVLAPRFSGKKISTIVLDPGHGGKDPGNRVAGRNEKTATLALAGEVQTQLKAAGFKVVLTRTKDQFVELPVRSDIANGKKADLFVSLHFNSFTGGDPASVSGPETYCITPVGASSSNAQGEGANYGPTPANVFEKKSLLLAYQVQRALVKNLGVTDRSVRRARFAVLRETEMPAILVEGGYMTQPTEGKKIFDAAYRKQMAAAIVKGILNYQKLTAPATVKVAAAVSGVASGRKPK